MAEQSLNSFEDLLVGSLMPFIQLSNQIGDLVAQQAQLTLEAFKAQRQFIEFASKSLKPSSDLELVNLLKPISDLITKIQEIRDKNRKHQQFNHLSALSEGIASLGWITVSPTPAPYVKEMTDSSQFYTNKILVEFKDQPDKAFHIQWAKCWIQFLTELQKYIRQYHTTGLIWAGVNTAGPAPPPPPPPPSCLDLDSKCLNTDKSIDDARAALFASINKGMDITKGLRKVTDNEMTHKNPTLRTSSVVPEKEMKNLSLGKENQKPISAKKPEKFELDGKKWIVENMTGKKDLMIGETEMNQSVQIYQCDDCVLTVKGKINSITVDRCQKFGLVFDSIVSFVEFINSKQIKSQAMGVIPTITIDCVDTIDLFLGAQSMNVEIISSKSSAINVSVLDNKAEFVEHPIPEQLKSTWNGREFLTEAIKKN